MKYVFVLIILAAMGIAAYAILSKKDDGSSTDGGETSKEKADRLAAEAALQLAARKAATANKPELYIVERYQTIDSDPIWSQNVEKKTTKRMPYKAQLLKEALNAAKTDRQISEYRLVNIGMHFSEDLFEIKINHNWTQFNINDLIAEFSSMQSGNLQ